MRINVIARVCLFDMRGWGNGEEGRGEGLGMVGYVDLLCAKKSPIFHFDGVEGVDFA